MALPINEPFREVVVYGYSTSIGTSPAIANMVSPIKGTIVRTGAVVTVGTTTGAGTVKVSTTLSGSTDIGSLLLPIGAAGTATTDTPAAAGVDRTVQEGDVITWTPASGGGASVTGHFMAVIRK